MEDTRRLEHELDGGGVCEAVQHVWMGLIEMGADHCFGDLLLVR